MPCHAQIRTFAPCPGDGNCNWVETGTPLQNGRWYATNQRMPDGSQAIFGGRSCDTVEYVPSKGAPVYIPLIANVKSNSLSLSLSHHPLLLRFFVLIRMHSRETPYFATQVLTSSQVYM
jgi:hypothetical protein